ncbi:recombination directionality factor [Mycolicibacter minnesotensis]
MIIDLQRRLAEIGRIRIGQQVATGTGKKRPAKLTTFRLTSADRNRIQQAAVLYGGTPVEWEAPAGKQWEVVTEADALNVICPPSDMAFSQHYELWSGGGCQRRCDGRNESISEGGCLCDPDKRECTIHTRLSVMLRDLPGLGVWRIDTSGYYAAVELQGAVEVVQLAAGRGQMLPARLRLEQRMIKRAGQGVKRFAVPVLDIEVSPAQLLGGGGSMAMLEPAQRGQVAIAGPPGQIDGRAPLTPVPDSVPETPVASVAEQAAAVKERRPRKNAAQPVARTGIKPRTAAQAAGGGRPPRDEIPPPPEPEPGPPPPAAPEPHRAPAAPDVVRDPNDPASTAQNRKMHALFREAEIAERADRLAVTSAILGFQLDTSAHLTLSEANKLIDTMERWKQDGVTDTKVRDILNTITLEAESASPATEQEN